jgi:hypothetical protein
MRTYDVRVLDILCFGNHDFWFECIHVVGKVAKNSMGEFFLSGINIFSMPVLYERRYIDWRNSTLYQHIKRHGNWNIYNEKKSLIIEGIMDSTVVKLISFLIMGLLLYLGFTVYRMCIRKTRSKNYLNKRINENKKLKLRC